MATAKCKEFIVLCLLLSSISGCQGCGSAEGGGDPAEAAAIVNCESAPAPPDLNSPRTDFMAGTYTAPTSSATNFRRPSRGINLLPCVGSSASTGIGFKRSPG